MWRFVVVVLVGCGSSESKPMTPVEKVEPTRTETSKVDLSAVDPAPCEEVAPHTIRISRTTGDTKEITELVLRRCQQDLWSLDARKCLLTSNTFDEGLACESKMTNVQLKGLEAAIKSEGSVMAKPRPQP